MQRSDAWKLHERRVRMRWNTAEIDRENVLARTERPRPAACALILKRNLKLLGGFIGNGEPPPPQHH